MGEASVLDTLLTPGLLRVFFQPVFDVSNNDHRDVHLLECLTRGPTGTNMESAAVLFEYARRKRQEIMVDRVCIVNALAAARCIARPYDLSINVHASTLERDAEFPGFLQKVLSEEEIEASRVTVEIVEHAPAWEGLRLRRTLTTLRALGMKVALDDIGLGQSNYRMILECEPEYFKIDRYLVHGCQRDHHRQAILESLVSLATRLGSKVIAEGVEDSGDLDMLRQLKIPLLQGFLLSRPVPASQLTGKVEAPWDAASQ